MTLPLNLTSVASARSRFLCPKRIADNDYRGSAVAMAIPIGGSVPNKGHRPDRKPAEAAALEIYRFRSGPHAAFLAGEFRLAAKCSFR